MGAYSTFTGEVAKVNANGFQVSNRDGWLNWSKFADERTMPEPGDGVCVTVDTGGYVRGLTRMNPAAMHERPNGKASTAVMIPATMAEAERASAPVAPDKERQITRMACLNTATAVLSSGGREVSPDSLLFLAQRLEFWVTRWA